MKLFSTVEIGYGAILSCSHYNHRGYRKKFSLLLFLFDAGTISIIVIRGRLDTNIYIIFKLISAIIHINQNLFWWIHLVKVIYQTRRLEHMLHCLFIIIINTTNYLIGTATGSSKNCLLFKCRFPIGYQPRPITTTATRRRP